MMITADELEEIIARTPAGERVVYENREIGECLLTAFATIGDPLDFRTRHQKGGAPDKSAAAETSNIPGMAESPGER